MSLDQNTIDYLKTDGPLTLALTMTGEAVGDARDGSSIEERIAVGCVVRNRLAKPGRFGGTWAGVCLRPWQFSCWNANDPNRRRLLTLADAYIRDAAAACGDDRRFAETLWLAGGIIQGSILDIVEGADHYFNPKIVAAPPWAFEDTKRTRLRKPDAVVGSHQFYALG